jgi:NADH dehydrogenase
MNDTLHPGSGAPTKVVVVGAGYAGMIATNRLLGSLTDEERTHVEVTVVNPRADLVERIRLHELAAGSRDSVLVGLGGLLHDEARLVVGWVERIDRGNRLVRVVREGEDPVELQWDHLVYAVGSTASATIPGARDHAHLLGDLDGASSAAAALRSGASDKQVVVIGGGLTGVESASEIAEQHPDAEVTLVCAGALLPSMRPSARRSVSRTLRRLGVTVVEDAAVAAVEPGKVVLEHGAPHPFDVCVVAASFTVPELARTSELTVDGSGRLVVDECLRSADDDRIVGAGDAVAVPDSVGGHLRMGCAVALPLGGHAAETVVAQLRGEEPRPISVGLVLQCVSLGRKRGYIQVVRADDSPRRFHVAGRLGATVKEKICRMVIDAPRRESTHPGAYSWPKGPASPR